jgi:hypothetical protein
VHLQRPQKLQGQPHCHAQPFNPMPGKKAIVLELPSGIIWQ